MDRRQREPTPLEPVPDNVTSIFPILPHRCLIEPWAREPGSWVCRVFIVYRGRAMLAANFVGTQEFVAEAVIKSAVLVRGVSRLEWQRKARSND